jgi:hypothetical protein
VPLFDFTCEAGHSFERLSPGWVDTLGCECGAVAKRHEVHRVAFALAKPSGDRVSDYYEAASEVEYQTSLSDTPASLAVAREVRPARYRGQARMWAEGKDTRWNPETDADERARRRAG